MELSWEHFSVHWKKLRAVLLHINIINFVTSHPSFSHPLIHSLLPYNIPQAWHIPTGQLGFLCSGFYKRYHNFRHYNPWWFQAASKNASILANLLSSLPVVFFSPQFLQMCCLPVVPYAEVYGFFLHVDILDMSPKFESSNTPSSAGLLF